MWRFHTPREQVSLLPLAGGNGRSPEPPLADAAISPQGSVSVYSVYPV